MDLAKLQAAVRARQEQIEAKKAGGLKAVKIPAGQSRWRILPGWRKDDPFTYYHDFASFWFKDQNGKVSAVIVAEGDTFGRPDPVADLVWGAWRAASDKDTKDRLKELLPARQVLVNAIQISGAGADPTKVVLLGLPNGVAEKFHNLVAARLEDGINMLDLKTGRDVIITKTGTGLNTEYSLVDSPKETAIDEGLLAQLVNIDAFIETKRQEGLQKGIGPVNDAIALALGGAPSSARASLASVMPAAAALAAPVAAATVTAAPAPAVAMPVAPTLAQIAPEPVVAQPVPAAAPVAAAPAGTPVPGFGGALDDAELSNLLASIGAAS